MLGDNYKLLDSLFGGVNKCNGMTSLVWFLPDKAVSPRESGGVQMYRKLMHEWPEQSWKKLLQAYY